MHEIASTDPTSLAWRLSASAYRHLVHTLCDRLPPPAQDTPQALAARNEAAIEAIAAMMPVNADEAELAARCVSARAQADEILRLFRAHSSRDDIKTLIRLNAQYLSLERAATAIHRELQRTQAARHKRETSSAAAQADEWTQHIAQQRMSGALQCVPAPQGQAAPPPNPLQQPAEAKTEAPHADSAPSAAPAAPPRANSPRPVQPQEPIPDLAAEADDYARTYTDRARLIRQQGGIPEDCDFGPPTPELAHAIATGTSPILRALDTAAARPPLRRRRWRTPAQSPGVTTPTVEHRAPTQRPISDLALPRADAQRTRPRAQVERG